MKKSWFILSLFIVISLSYSYSNIFPEISMQTNMQLETKLKAVLVVGPQQDGTTEAIKKIDELAAYLKTQNVSTYCFYDTKADWEKIYTAANGAHIFVYSGHGTTLGGEGKVGGLCLADDSFISSEDIVTNLKLATNALVLFKSVCFGAGSSASDDDDIGITTAVKRVNEYATPFFKCGAGCYYANNFDNGCLNFLKDLFAGKDIIDCFTISAKNWTKIEADETSTIGKDIKVGVASHAPRADYATRYSYNNGVKTEEKIKTFKNYSIAYVANPYYSIENLKGSKTIEKSTVTIETSETEVNRKEKFFNDDDVVNTQTTTTTTEVSKTKFYIIVASYTELAPANAKVKTLINEGYSQAKTLTSGNKIRITLKEFSTKLEAQEEISNLRETFPGVWILEQ